jgi:anti-anti-sigma factor
MSHPRPVIVKQLPEILVAEHACRFLLEAIPIFQHDHPNVVFDFSDVRQIDGAGVAMLLNCIEEALKRNGDLKLASVSPSAAGLLETMEVDSLFDVFETVSDAVDSFQRIPGYEIPWSGSGYVQSQSLASGDD